MFNFKSISGISKLVIKFDLGTYKPNIYEVFQTENSETCFLFQQF